jgi:hypothetical protein
VTRSLLVVQSLEDAIQLALKISLHVLIAKAQDPVPIAQQSPIPREIVREVPVVRLPVKLDDQVTLDASEVRIEAPHRALTAKFVAAQPPISELRPHQGFGPGRDLAQ